MNPIIVSIRHILEYQDTYRDLEQPWWRHEMESFTALLALCAGISPVTVEFPSQRPVTRSFDAFLYVRL